MSKKILFVGALPPPLHGFSKINNEMLRLIKEDNCVTTVNTASCGGGIIKELINIFIIPLLVLYRLIKEKHKVLYIGLNGGERQIIDTAIIALADIFNLKMYIHHHSFAYINRVRFYNRVMFYFSRKAEHIVLCEAMRVIISRIYKINVERITVLSNAAFLSERVSEENYHEKNNLCIGFLSNITREKGIFIFFDIMDVLLKENVNFSAVIAGPIDASIEAEFYERLKLHSSVRYLGAIYDKDKDNFFEGINILLFPTIYENEAEPITIIESLSYSVPVISLERGCIRSLININNGFIFDRVEYVSRAVKVLKKIESNTSSIRDLSTNAHKTFIHLRDSSKLVKKKIIDEITLEKNK